MKFDVFQEIIKKLSVDEIDVEESRHLANLKRLDPMRVFYNVKNFKVMNQGYAIPVRCYFPNHAKEDDKKDIFLYLHGGGWTTDSIDTYDRICAKLANATDHLVMSVDYRLAPEHKFPIGLEDCYKVAHVLFKFVDASRITLIGDSAGGNLVAALSLMARDRNDFNPQRQILIYPAVNSVYTDESPFESVQENGSDYILTQGKLQDYIDLYCSQEADKTNPYFAPIYAQDVSNQPATLIITAEFDPLKDEGQAYGKMLFEAGNDVEMYEVKNAMHGFFALGIKEFFVQESFDVIQGFLQSREGDECQTNESIGEN